MSLNIHRDDLLRQGSLIGEKIGFEKGDIIIQIAEENIKNMEDFNKALASAKGKKTLVWVNRGGLFQGLVIK